MGRVEQEFSHGYGANETYLTNTIRRVAKLAVNFP